MNDRGRTAACGLALVALTAVVCGGCSGNEDAATGPTARHVVAPREPVEFRLAIVDRAGFDAVIERLRGHVVLVDCWATWCIPCIGQLPHTVELARRHRGAGLAVVLLSLDSPSDSDAVRAAIVKAGATGLTNLVSQFGSGSESVQAFEIPGGALPHYKLYDRSGQLRRTFGLDPAAKKQFTPADVAAAVDELLAK